MKQLFKVLLIICLGSSALLSQEVKDGSLSVLVFSNGKPLVSNEIKVDGKKVFRTDSDGALQTRLKPGSHQIEIFGKDAQGVNLGYFKKQVRIEKAKDTQVIATLSKTGADTIDIDVPVESAVQEDVKVEASTGTGTLNGRVLSSQGNKPIAGARVFVRGTSVDTRTDANGRFSATVPSGKSLSISVVHSAYSAQTVGGIKVKANGSTSKTVKLTPASMELEEFVVLAPKVEGSITDIIQEEKNINAVANILGSEEISKKGDSDAASALKRVSGITLIGGKSIFVRGLGERYSNVDMNSMPLPSPDPLKRVVPLDIFPASAIGSMKVQKSASANIPAAFGGGYIDIRTKDEKDEDFMKISLGLSGSSYTGDSVINYTGDSNDFLGFSDGYREIPNTLSNFAQIRVGERVPLISPTTFDDEELHNQTKDFLDREYKLQKETLPLGYSFGLEGLKNFKLYDDHEIAVYANYNYGQKNSYYREDIIGTTSEGKVGIVGFKEQTNNEYTHDALFNVSYNYLDILKLRYTKLFSHTGDKSAKFTDGIFGSNFFRYQFSDLDWEERTMDVDQINGSFTYELLNLKNVLDFGMEYATARLYQPNDVRYRPIIEDDGLTHFEKNKSANFLFNKIESDDAQYAIYLNNKIYPEFFDEKDEIYFGTSYSFKSREAYTQQFYLKQINTNDILAHEEDVTDIDAFFDTYVRDVVSPDDAAYSVRNFFGPGDYYDAEVSYFSAHLGTILNPYETLSVNAGLRYVNLEQSIFQYLENKFNRNIIEKVETKFDVNQVYPSFSVKYKPYDKHQFDLALSQTYITPDLREFSGGQFRHPNEIALIEGNSDLEPTQILNFDLKYSYFMSDAEFLKFGVFYKYLDKPIEDTAVLTTSLPKYSYINSDSAILYGVEFDYRVTLDVLRFGHSFETFEKYLGKVSNYYLSGNISYTDSEVTLTDEQKELLTSSERGLQGLSNAVFNMSLGYDSDMRNVTLSYNKMGERLRKVGLIDAGAALPDLYETPPHLLDFVWQEKLDGGYAMSVKFKNLLDSPVEWTRNDQVVQRYKVGTSFSLSGSYKF